MTLRTADADRSTEYGAALDAYLAAARALHLAGNHDATLAACALVDMASATLDAVTATFRAVRS